MAPKKKKKSAKSNKASTPQVDLEALSLKREMFCRYISQNATLFGNGTLCYAEAYGYNLEELSRDDAKYEWKGRGKKRERVCVEPSSFDKAYNVCAVEAARLLRNPKILERIRELLNEILKNDVVDARLAEHIMQQNDGDRSLRGIAEYNKLRGRIIDKVKDVSESFTLDDIRTLLAPLPQERQDQVYGVITSAIAEAEQLLRGEKKI